MARFHGEVGYGESVETPPDSGVWRDQITEVPYYGDVVRNIMRLSEGDRPNELNQDILVNNSISVVADEYAIKHYHLIKYVRWEGVLWSVTSVDVRSPRLVLNLGKVYNGPTP